MIISQITSGLGNQMFQYAVARRMAVIYQTPFKLDLSWFNIYDSREYGLKHFNITESIASDAEIASVKKQNFFKESQFTYNPGIQKAQSPVYLAGYWQSEKYFKDIEAILRREFTIKQQPDEANRKLAQWIENSPSVSLHIRRTDYLYDLNHGVCPLDYYYQAVEFVTNVIAEARFFVFSDDWQWVKDHLKLKYPHTIVTINSGSTAYFDLALMNLCQHHIIANSTFSWWGAWLSQNQSKIVVAPKKWFQALPFDTSDLIPDSWQVI